MCHSHFLLSGEQLYGEFADHFHLSECKLAIIHCAGHSDPILVHALWQEIMDKGEGSREWTEVQPGYMYLLLVIFHCLLGLFQDFPKVQNVA